MSNKPILTAGNDFYLRVNVYTRNAQGEREPFNLSACDKWAFFLRNTYGANLKDGLHPNEKGQNLMTRAIVTAVRNNWLKEDYLNT